MRFALKICGLASDTRARKESHEGREELLERASLTARLTKCSAMQVYHQSWNNVADKKSVTSKLLFLISYWLVTYLKFEFCCYF